jgi:minor extracellular serine protease Vpr
VKHTAALLLVILVGSAIALPAQDIVPGKYIVELAGQTLAEAPKSKQTERRAAMQSERLRVRAAMAASAVDITNSVESVANALIVNASPEQAAQLAAMPGVARVTPVKLYRKLLDRAVGLQKILEGWAQIGGNGSAGSGVKIGIIDTGIDASHPAFADFGLQVPDGFPKVNRDVDLQNTNPKVIVARNYDRGNSAKDVDGHGTGVAMIAAGVTNTGPRATITGIAPKAFLGNYKVFPDGGDGARTDYILKALDDAFADGMDVVNLSLGSYPAERFSDDPLAQAVERAARLGMIVVVAAGNEGPDQFTIAAPATAPSAISVGNAFTDRVFASTASLEDVESYVVLPGSGRNSSSAIRAAVADVNNVDPTGLACSALAPESLAGRIALVLRGTCFFEEKLNNVQRAGAVAALVYAREESPDAITMEVGGAGLPAAMLSYRDGLRLKARVAENGDRTLLLDFSQRPSSVDPSRLSQSSSKGPNNDLSIKPDLIAVGTSVYTAAPNGGYIAESGTSFSAPMVAGAAAVLKAARPGLSAQQIRSLLINNASTFAALPLQQTGVGILNLAAALRGTVAANPPSIAFNSGGGTVDLIRSFSLRNISNAADTFTITVAPSGVGGAATLSTNTVDLAPGASQEITVRLQGTNLEPGAYEGVLVVRGTQSEVESRIPYWYGVASPKAAVISVIEQPITGRTSSTQRLRFHVLDAVGVPLVDEPKVTVERGDGVAMSIESFDSVYPGLFVASVRLSEFAGENVFAIEAGGIKKLISITGE